MNRRKFLFGSSALIVAAALPDIPAVADTIDVTNPCLLLDNPCFMFWCKINNGAWHFITTYPDKQGKFAWEIDGKTWSGVIEGPNWLVDARL